MPPPLSPNGVDAHRRRGRGANSNASGRFEPLSRSSFDDGWESLATLDVFRTQVTEETTKTIITRNQSPDISFDRSINPYRGCEHGCIYCYARPSHCYLGLSAGIDFETQLFSKPNAAELLERELAARNYLPKSIALGANTDPYQPVERRLKITRSILEVLSKTQHPVGIVTKSQLVLRDIDILAPMAAKGLARVAVSITTLDHKLARLMEPRATTPMRRLNAVHELNAAGIPTSVMVAPILPALTDHELEAILEAAHEHGAHQAGYVLLRLPLEIRDLFQEWLHEHFPDRAARVIKLMRDMRGGKDYDARWGIRQRGTGPYADQIAVRFKLALKRLGMNRRTDRLRTDLFIPPTIKGQQLPLF